VLAIGSCFDEGSLESHPSSSKRCHWISFGKHWLAGKMMDEPNLSIDMIQVSFLLSLAWQTNPSGASRFAFTHDLVRMAMQIGLHQEPTIHFPNISTEEAELRRRLWSTMVELSIQASFEDGLPPPVLSDAYDCEPVSNLEDEDIAITLEPAYGMKCFTRSTVHALLAQTQKLRLRVLNLVNNSGVKQITYEDIAPLAQELSAACNANMELLRKLASSSGPKPTAFQIKVLDTYTRRFLLALYDPFADKARTNPADYYARKVRMDICTLIIAHPLPQTLLPTVTLDHVAEDDHYSLLLTRNHGLFAATVRHATASLCLDLIDELEANLFPFIDSERRLNLLRAVQRGVSIAERRLSNRSNSTTREYLVFTCAAAHIEALLGRRSGTVDQVIAEEAKKALETCCSVLEGERKEDVDGNLGSDEGDIETAEMAVLPLLSGDEDAYQMWDSWSPNKYNWGLDNVSFSGLESELTAYARAKAVT
jgi:hypothetical protein